MMKGTILFRYIFENTFVTLCIKSNEQSCKPILIIVIR